MKLFAEMNRDELRAAAPQSLAVLPIGATEQHGPHLPTGTDVFAVETVAREAAAQLPEDVPVIVTPTLPFGSSHHHVVFGATLSLFTGRHAVYSGARMLALGGLAGGVTYALGHLLGTVVG